MSQILAAFNAADRRREDDAADGAVEDLRGAVRLSLQPAVGDGRAGRSSARKAYFKWFNEDHADDQHRYDYREWFNRVNQQPRIAGNAPYLNQVRTAALATLTDAEKADPELAAILAAYRPPAPGRGGRGRQRRHAAPPPADGGGAVVMKMAPAPFALSSGRLRRARDRAGADSRRLHADLQRPEPRWLASEPDDPSRDDRQLLRRERRAAASQRPFGQGGLLLTDKVYKDFELYLEVEPRSRVQQRRLPALDRKRLRPIRSRSTRPATRPAI